MMILQLLAACAVGALLMYGYTRWRGREDVEVKRLRARLTAKTDELAAYKSDVREHFLDTAEAVDALTSAHQEVFAQLERGAQHLVGDGHFRGALKPDAPKLDVLKHVTNRLTPGLVTAGKAVNDPAEESVDEVTGKPVGQLTDTFDKTDDVLDNPASASQRPPPNLTPSRN